MMLLLLVLAQDLAQLSQQGAQAIRERRFSDAERAYRQLLKVDPANPAWHMNLGLTFHLSSRYAEAVPELQLFLKAKPQPGPMHLLLGLSQLKLSRACDAIAPLEKARAWNAEQTVVELADAYYGCKRFLNAARTYESALTTKHKSDTVARQAAHCYWEARQYPDAQRLFANVATTFAQDADFNYEYGDTLARIEGPAAGVPYLERAAATKPTLLAARGELGKALQALGRNQEAIPHLEAASAADPVLLLPLSRAYRAMGRVADSERVQAEYRRQVNSEIHWVR